MLSRSQTSPSSSCYKTNVFMLVDFPAKKKKTANSFVLRKAIWYVNTLSDMCLFTRARSYAASLRYQNWAEITVLVWAEALSDMVFVPGLMSSGVAFSSIHSGTSISRKAKGQEEFVHHNKVSLYRHCIPYILLIIIAIANKNKRATILPILFHLAGITIIYRK